MTPGFRQYEAMMIKLVVTGTL